MALQVGSRLDHYKVTALIAEGVKYAYSTAFVVLASLIWIRSGEAGQQPVDAAPASTTSTIGKSLQTFDGPPVPIPPAVISRDASGRVTVRAQRLATPLRIDGRLDEAVYASVPPMSNFIQAEPAEGSPANEKTEVWVFFDDEHIYIVGRCWETHPERIMANEMRRDNVGIVRNDNIAWSFDTFFDKRNGVLFEVNPIGGRLDGQVTNESQINTDWNPVWDLATGAFDEGWVMEAALPFKSLRYRPGREQTWGLQVRRWSRWRNEISYLTPIPASFGGRGHFQVSLAATLAGLEAPPGARNLEIKPYAISDVTSDLTATRAISNEVGGNVGIDLKYGVTQNLTADVTVNTDFAQVEADEQQVNLTRFSLFFPEKREFFLENQGLFAFGGAGAGPFGGGGQTPVLFYSRQIGLDEGREVPIDAGGRLTGRVGPFSIGMMTVRTGDQPVTGAQATNSSVVRLKRDVLRRSSVGAIFTRRSVSTRGAGSDSTYGIDGTFAFYDNLKVNTYWATTGTRGLGGDDVSYRTQLDYAGDRYGVQLERLIVGTDFSPELGFLRREDFERSFASFRFSTRPRGIAAIRKLSWEGQFDYIVDRASVLETRQAQGRFGVEFENSDQFDMEYTRSYEFLEQPFQIASNVMIPVGGYRFQDVLTSLELGRQRRLSGTVSVQHGSFFSGDKTTVRVGLGGGPSGGRLELTPQFSVEPGFSLNWIDLPEGQFATQIVTTRTTYTFTPLMFVSALLQYNSSNDSLGANLRFRWEYQPGSELFVVYNEQRDTLSRGAPELENRTFIIKINRLFRF